MFGLITALPKIVPGMSSGEVQNPVSNATYKDYRDSQRTSTSGPVADSNGADAGQAVKIDSRIVTASQNFVAWGTKNGNNYDLGTVERALDGKQKSLSDAMQGDYADSLVQLSRDVLASAGPQDDINQLIDWHFGKFTAAQADAAAAAQTREVKLAAEKQEALVLASAAGAAFLAFLILLFVFVLVKIERNLRLVTVQMGGASPGTGAAPS
jgi:hypothetical protein